MNKIKFQIDLIKIKTSKKIFNNKSSTDDHYKDDKINNDN